MAGIRSSAVGLPMPYRLLARTSHRYAKRGRGDACSYKANASQGAQAYWTVLSGTLAAFNAVDAGRSASAAVNG